MTLRNHQKSRNYSKDQKEILKQQTTTIKMTPAAENCRKKGLETLRQINILFNLKYKEKWKTKGPV